MEKSFSIEKKTNKNNIYSITFTLGSNLGIEANQMNDLIKKTFSNEFSLDDIVKKNTYFRTYNSFEDVFEELKDRITEEEETTVEENENSLKIKVPVPNRNNKEIIFTLKQNNKNENEKLNDLSQLINKQNKEMTDLKNEINELKKDINDIKMRFDVFSKSKKERQTIDNLDSKIINEKEECYNMDLKRWINPNKNLRAQLLYRLSENGEKYETFHELCDKKGPTLTLFHLKENGLKLGIYTPLSWDKDNNINNKSDLETFIFNLNKEQKYKKVNPSYSVYCQSNYGPYTQYFGCFNQNTNDSMKFMYCYNYYYCRDGTYYLDQYFEKGHEILPYDSTTNSYKKYELMEAEVFKIIIE